MMAKVNGTIQENEANFSSKQKNIQAGKAYNIWIF
jgi:hypothetical protein